MDSVELKLLKLRIDEDYKFNQDLHDKINKQDLPSSNYNDVTGEDKVEKQKVKRKYTDAHRRAQAKYRKKYPEKYQISQKKVYNKIINDPVRLEKLQEYRRKTLIEKKLAIKDEIAKEALEALSSNPERLEQLKEYRRKKNEIQI
jgi:hypothetical protein